MAQCVWCLLPREQQEHTWVRRALSFTAVSEFHSHVCAHESAHHNKYEKYSVRIVNKVANSGVVYELLKGFM